MYLNLPTVITCLMLEPLDSGTISYFSEVEVLAVGAQAIHSCDTGFSLVGNAARSCSGNGHIGQWNGTTPLCQGEASL